jgi:hypothetical protein
MLFSLITEYHDFQKSQVFSYSERYVSVEPNIKKKGITDMRTRVKRSVVWKMTDIEFEKLVSNSNSVGDICQKLSHRKGGSVFSNIKRRIAELNIYTHHFVDGRTGIYSITYVSKKEFLRRIDNNEQMDPGWFKKKLIEFSILKNECKECSMPPVWNGKPITFHLDHIDGDYANCKIPNLRLLCPNCHSQTETYSLGKNRKRKTYFCITCGSKTAGYSTRCLKCATRERHRKVVGNTGIEPVNQECHSCSLPLA